MSDKPNRQSPKTDWSEIEARTQRREMVSTSSVDNVPEDSLSGPAASETPLAVPVTEAPKGLLLKIGKNNILRKAAHKALQLSCDKRLEALTHHYKSFVDMSKADSERTTNEFLLKIKFEHDEFLSELGLRDKDSRISASIKLTDMILSKLKEVRSKDWPKQLVDRTIDDLLQLEKKFYNEIMDELAKELGE